jgi:hypothetical protein
MSTTRSSASSSPTTPISRAAVCATSKFLRSMARRKTERGCPSAVNGPSVAGAGRMIESTATSEQMPSLL